jgi:hypothetical protein
VECAIESGTGEAELGDMTGGVAEDTKPRAGGIGRRPRGQ